MKNSWVTERITAQTVDSPQKQSIQEEVYRPPANQLPNVLNQIEAKGLTRPSEF
jgi:hypothetical protein